MKKFLYSFLISSLTYGAIDTGTGADGACNWSGTIASQTYNCTDLTISGATTFSGTNPVIVKVQGDVFINFSISLNGQTGAAGGVAIAGGYNGGAPSTNGSGPLANTMGIAGGNAVANPDIAAGGGGGSGGASATLGGAGITGSSSDGGAGGVAPTVISNTSNNLPTTINGGAGGGGGGSDDDTPTPGGRGGAGAGVLKISAGGNIVINAAITLNGGAGQNGSANSGGGGGGAGGALYFETEGDITNNSSISALGGAIGTGAGNGGNGGSGGNGIIRLDDFDGIVAGSGTSNPSAISLKTGVAGTSTQTAYSSDINPGCVLREVNDENSIYYFFSFLILLTLTYFHNIFKIKSLKEI